YPGGLFVPDAGASVVGNTAINAIRKPAYGSVRGLIVILQDRLNHLARASTHSHGNVLKFRI
ncbi:hypothetical protein, partial [Pseudoxanthomonas wuyuanensis]|uniref:hypothetical protein n=1 Tax=Pseudoxanthomonas wuyuanensis TaxID=1073196 RepID=UPI001EE4619F